MRAQSLRRWLASRVAWVAALPLAAVAALIGLWLAPQIRTDLETHHQALARAVASQIETYLLGAQRQLDAVAGLRRDLGYRPAPYWFVPLDAHVGAGGVFEAIYLVDAADSVHSVGLPEAERGRRPDLLELDLSGRGFLRQARARGDTVWSEVFLSAVTGRLAVALTIPVMDQVIVGEIAIEPLTVFLNRLPDESDLLAIILDRRDQVIAHSRRALGGQQLNLSNLPIIRATLRDQFATQSFLFEGEELVGTMVGVPRIGWTVLVARPRREVFRPVSAMLWVMAAGVGVALLLATLAGWGLAREFARRFDRYTGQAHAVAKGDYDRPWPTSHIAEFADLANDFQRMVLAIHQREQALQASETRYRLLFERAHDAIFVVEKQTGRYLDANRAAERLTGRTVAELKTLRTADVTPTSASKRLLQTSATTDTLHLGEVSYLRPDGVTRIALSSVIPVSETLFFAMAHDVTERKTAERRVERLAYYDALTDLPNRALLAQRAELALALAARRGADLALLFLDLDRFKEVNDSLGHAVGDALLVQVATRLQQLTRDADTVCRLGGDEFVLLLPDAGRDGALQVADKLLATFREPFAVAGHHLQVTTSVGIALYPHDGATFGDLLKNADAALYRAKQNGRNTRAFY
ncbi:MAG: diguanylate cyclase [Candidatus Contendobacter sp.]